jgi:hypothetical protein
VFFLFRSGMDGRFERSEGGVHGLRDDNVTLSVIAQRLGDMEVWGCAIDQRDVPPGPAGLGKPLCDILPGGVHAVTIVKIQEK